MKFTILGLLLLSSLQSQANECWQAFKAQTTQQMQEREAQYRAIDPKFSKITDISRAYTVDGTKDELVMLIHGFLATPNEVRTVADRLNQQGYAIYSGLIPGYGATAKVANKFTNKEWITWNESEIARVEKCFSKIHVVGFSTGATLFHDYVSKNPEDKKIASVTLISAFFKTHFMFNMALKLVKASDAKEVKMTGIFKHLPVSDVQVIIDNPQTYLQVAPLISLQQVVDLGRENKKREIPKKSLVVPTLAIYSEEDMVSDPDTIEKVVKRNFKNLNVVSYDDPGHVPHQLMVESVSQVAERVHDVIVKFIEQN